MNPKFRDLQIQAFAECKTFEDSQFRTDEVFERFAELIVRECTSLTLDYKNSEHYRGWLDYRNEIRKHFGVEE